VVGPEERGRRGGAVQGHLVSAKQAGSVQFLLVGRLLESAGL
jgi:hypothetical protein